MQRPVLLDIFCGAGGCSDGYHRAGFDVVGVDIKPQPRYPYRFVQGDANRLPIDLLAFDAIHASPPCQGYSKNMKHLARGDAPLLIDGILAMLIASGKPWVVENVEGSPLLTETDLFGNHGVLLCGSQFGLRIWRHRLFQTSFPIEKPPSSCRHDLAPLNPHREASRQRMRQEFGKVDLEHVWREFAGVPWMDKKSGRQAVPPIYTEFIGKQLRKIIGN